MYALFLLAGLLGAGKSRDPPPGRVSPAGRGPRAPERLCRPRLSGPLWAWRGTRTAQACAPRLDLLCGPGLRELAGRPAAKEPRAGRVGPGPGGGGEAGGISFRAPVGARGGGGGPALPRGCPSSHGGESSRGRSRWAHVIEVEWSPIQPDTLALGPSCPGF